MSFLYDNVVAIMVALSLSTVAWIFGGARGELLLPVVPWLLAFTLEAMLCFPQRHTGETTYAARSRAWRELRRSPLVWTAVGVFALLLVPFFNPGLCPGCDADLIAQGARAQPRLPMLPFCVNRLNHLDVVQWFAVALLSMVAVSHCMTRRGKRAVIELIMWNGVLLAVLGFVQGATSAPGPFWIPLANGKVLREFFSTFGYPNMAGDYFVTMFGLSVALWRDRCEQLRREFGGRDPSEISGSESKRYGVFWRKNYFLLPAAVFFFAALNTLSRAAIILVTASAVVYFLHTLILSLSRMDKSRRVYVGVWSLLVFGLVIFFATIFMPKKIQREVNTLETVGMLDRVTGKSQYHVRVATSIWKDHPLFGCGGWGYAHFAPLKMTPEERRHRQGEGGINVHNDYLQFLAEHGLVVFGGLVFIVVLLLRPICRQWRQMVKVYRFKKGKNLPPKPVQVFALPAPVLFIMVTALCTLVHAFGDCPLRSCAVLSLFFVSLAALPGFMHKGDRHHHHHG